jgi:hypothetical protein
MDLSEKVFVYKFEKAPNSPSFSIFADTRREEE